MTSRFRVLTLTLALTAPGRADEPAFVAPSSGQAVDQPGGKHVSFPVEAGKRYTVLKHGGPGGTWCKLAPPTGGTPGWIPCDGSPAVAGGERTAQSVGGKAHCATSCSTQPLFAKLPELTPLDREVLGICPARPDASATLEDVRRFIGMHVDDPRVQRALSAAGRPGDRSANVEWLASLWVGKGPRNAFSHWHPCLCPVLQPIHGQQGRRRLRGPGPGGVTYRIWCGTRNGSYGIATLYPTAERATCGP
jgi:hypothetical protein